jgi:hypothetical protein
MPRLRQAIPKEGMTAEYFGDVVRVNLEEPPLPLVLVFASVLENTLMTLLHTYFIKCDITEDMFDIKGELDSFSRCSRMARCLGFVSKASFDNLRVIGRIRNNFAHSKKILDFADSEVAKLCEKLVLPPIALPPKVMAMLDGSQRLGPAETNRNKFIWTCLPLIGYLRDAIQTIEPVKSIAESPLWERTKEIFERGTLRYQEIMNHIRSQAAVQTVARRPKWKKRRPFNSRKNSSRKKK